MKKVLALVVIAGSITLFSCENNKKDATADKAKADSTRMADSIALVKAKADSTAKAAADTSKKAVTDTVKKDVKMMEKDVKKTEKDVKKVK